MCEINMDMCAFLNTQEGPRYVFLLFEQYGDQDMWAFVGGIIIPFE